MKDSVLLERLFLILKRGGGQYKQAVRTPLRLTTMLNRGDRLIVVKNYSDLGEKILGL